MKSQKKVVIVDACIARSASKSEHPVSTACRSVLEQVREQGYYIGMNKMLFQEWRKHNSRYASAWLASMVSSKKIYTVTTENLEIREKAIKEYEVHKRISEKEATAILKDIHLLDVVFETNGVLFSCDENIRVLFYRISNQIGEIVNVIWINPVNDKEAVDYFFRDDIRLKSTKTIGHLCS
ncbi:MAG: hypothetical protein ACRDDX_05700 [Cellulosilyticaceae bacterium]